MPPISERVPEPYDNRSVVEDAPSHIPIQGGETPSPRTPTTVGSLSPPPRLPDAGAVVPMENGIPFDHTLPHYIRQVAGEPVLEEVQNISLRVLTDTASLQQMTLYTPNLRELNLEGSGLTSLRDIGSELRMLQVLRIGRCRLRSLDGTLGLTNLRELHAAGNMITSAAPCAHLSKLRMLDLSRNQLRDTRSLGFLGSCRRLQHLRLVGNPVTGEVNLLQFLRAMISTLVTLNDNAVNRAEIDRDDVQIYEREDSLSLSLSSDGDATSSRVSSAASNSTSAPNTSLEDDNN